MSDVASYMQSKINTYDVYFCRVKMAGASTGVRWFETNGCGDVLLVLMLRFCVGFLQAYKHVHFTEI